MQQPINIFYDTSSGIACHRPLRRTFERPAINLAEAFTSEFTLAHSSVHAGQQTVLLHCSLLMIQNRKPLQESGPFFLMCIILSF